MKSSAKNIVLKSVDDIFQTEENRADAQRERVQEIPLDQLKPFKNHPFKVRDDQRMLDTVDSIREYGVLVPAIARPDPEGGYELISGHRRKRGCEMAGLQTMPVIIRDLDDDAAVLVMVDSNIQREELLPSERAFAYKMKLEALKHQGARSDLTSRQVVGKLEMADVVGQNAGESGRQVQRYIRLTELISELLDMVDERKLAFNPAVEVSYLKRDEQRMLLEAMDAEQTTPSLSQAQRLKKFSLEGRLTEEAMSAIMSANSASWRCCKGGGWHAVSAAQAAGADVETGSTLQGEIRDLHRNTLFFTPIRTLSNPDLTNRDLIKKNSYCFSFKI